MTRINSEYEKNLHLLRYHGHPKTDRTGTGTSSLFGLQMRFDLKGMTLPLITTKTVHLRSIIQELLWFITGSTNNNWLKERNVSIWNDWAKEDGDLGPIYGAQWRFWQGKAIGLKNANPVSRTEDKMHFMGEPIYQLHDQLADAIDLLKTNPDSRRILISAWNVGYLQDMALMPCHALFQFYSRTLTHDERCQLAYPGDMTVDWDDVKTEALDRMEIPSRALSCQLYQRSGDFFLGVPFNIASYALLTHMIAQQTGHVAEEFVWTGGDCHLYNNHRDQAELQLTRDVREFPKLILHKADSIDGYTLESFGVLNYDPHPAIKAPIAV